jgi:YegS/Rv2252/BmrU family lipid kinase
VTSRITIIFNPTAGRRGRLDLSDVLARLQASGWTVDMRPTARRGDAERFARAIAALPAAGRPDVVAIAGGDGTIGEAVNGITSAAPSPPLQLGIIPMGTANVLAAEIGLRVEAAHVAATIDGRHVKQVHAGLLDGRAFTLMAGVGFDAHVVAELDERLKRRIGKGAYLVAAVRLLFRFRFPTYCVRVDGGAPLAAASVIVTRGRFYGGRHTVAPGASLVAPLLHVCLFERKGVFHVLRYALALGLGQLPRSAGYRILTGHRVEITGPVGDPVQGDGDILGRLPATIELAARPVGLIVP